MYKRGMYKLNLGLDIFDYEKLKSIQELTNSVSLADTVRFCINNVYVGSDCDSILSEIRKCKNDVKEALNEKKTQI